MQRLDAGRAVEAVRELTGVRLTPDGPCPGGQVGAAYVRWPEGRRSVLKWRPHTRVAELRDGALAVAEELRRTGYPAPATELAVQVGHAVVTVQELLPGSPVDQRGGFDGSVLDQLLALNDLQAGRLAGRPDVPAVELYLRTDGPGYCLHEPLRQYGRRGAALERRVAAVGAGYPAVLPGDDAVHLDFQPGNVLVEDGSVTGVIDWDGAARGDRRFDLVTLRFGLHVGRIDPAVTRRLDAALDAMPEEVLRPAWAHMSLRMVDWAVRHFAAQDVEHWLDLAEQRGS
ncbi:Phosphotransferase enzyme family protein [Streptomyces sp. YIM 130001]|nr:Phosphotransferase enzyme family protein [Streptomyces sp. YIM 130001]